MNIMHNKTE